MRSAREWEMQIGFESALQKDIIQQIQLDAMKEGMRSAAEIVARHGWRNEPQMKHILSDADQLTIKDLEV